MIATTENARWTRSVRRQLQQWITGGGPTACESSHSLWRRVCGSRGRILFQGQLYCSAQCLKQVLAEEIRSLQLLELAPRPGNRIPLGLLMVARGKLSYPEVQAALEAQRRARYGKIGDWFEKLGFATEHEVTAALALQWGCPLAASVRPNSLEAPHQVPFAILEALRMWPWQYSAATNTLCLAFGERVDHSALYAIERMLDCRTQPCVAPRKVILRLLAGVKNKQRACEMDFGVMRDPAEMARISESYVSRLGPDEIRLRRVGSVLWLRLKTRGPGANVVFRLRHEPVHPLDVVGMAPLLQPSTIPEYQPPSYLGD